jgi:hypothetical protein
MLSIAVWWLWSEDDREDDVDAAAATVAATEVLKPAVAMVIVGELAIEWSIEWYE